MNTPPLRVLVVDDSRIFRGIIETALAGQPGVRVVGSVWSGEKALELAREQLPDFVTLDIQMPGLGGIATLKALRELATARRHPLGVLLVSAHTRQGAAVTVEGLQEGAFDFLHKPDSPDPRANEATLRRQLLEKIELWRNSRQPGARRGTGPAPTPSPPVPAPAVQRGICRYRALLIGSSTGGPEALSELLPKFAPQAPLPILLVQHLPADFASYFAHSLARRVGVSVVEAYDGQPAVAGRIYLAPGGSHLVLRGSGSHLVCGLSDSPPENGCRPAVDVLFRSAAAACGDRALALVLTGMGQDGARGALALRRAGSRVLVQDQESSVVWGMPGTTVEMGAADEVLSLVQLGDAVRRLLGMGD
ncbi:MAG: chemotaxis-specific protein-glutamate methyltransferase CheB [Planctomycetaceae bacterium]|jgi:two-component system chemotaxis response regulator CheB